MQRHGVTSTLMRRLRRWWNILEYPSLGCICSILEFREWIHLVDFPPFSWAGGGGGGGGGGGRQLLGRPVICSPAKETPSEKRSTLKGTNLILFQLCDDPCHGFVQRYGSFYIYLQEIPLSTSNFPTQKYKILYHASSIFRFRIILRHALPTRLKTSTAAGTNLKKKKQYHVLTVQKYSLLLSLLKIVEFIIKWTLAVVYFCRYINHHYFRNLTWCVGSRLVAVRTKRSHECDPVVPGTDGWRNPTHQIKLQKQ